jgi:hypothetical protein
MSGTNLAHEICCNTSPALASPVNPNTAMSFGIGMYRKDRKDGWECITVVPHHSDTSDLVRSQVT